MLKVVMNYGRLCAALGVVGMLAAGCGGGAGPTMDGSALLARVRAAYLHVPAVQTVLSINNQNAQSYTHLLRHGIVTNELYHMRLPAPDLVIAYGNGRAYEFRPKPRCWVLDPEYGVSQDDRGSRFPDIASRQVKTARRVGSVWQLPVAKNGHTEYTMLVDAKTFLVKRLVFATGGGHDVERYKALRQAPTFPTPRPLCRK
jgi:hypothetical protein